MAVAHCRGFAWHEPGFGPQYHFSERRERTGEIRFHVSVHHVCWLIGFFTLVEMLILFAFIALNIYCDYYLY